MKMIDANDQIAAGTVIHRFETAGLGKAPFRFTGMNVNTYQAYQGAPAKPGGCCDFCGNSIMYEFFIKSADGKSFKVGSDCINKVGDNGLCLSVNRIVREQKRNSRNAAIDARINAAKAKLDSVKEQLSAIKSTNVFRQNESRYDQVRWFLSNAGRTGRLWAAKEIEKISV